MATAPATGDTLGAGARRQRLLGHDRPVDLAWAAAPFAVFFVLDRLSSGAADVDADRLRAASLLAAAVRSNPIHWATLVALAAAMLIRRRREATAGWSALEHGTVIRGLIAPPIALLAWQYSLYDLNFVLDRWHLLDRLLVVVLAAGCWWRPALLVPFAIQTRIVESQFSHPFGTLAAQNIDELLVIAVVAVASVHVLYVVAGRNDTAPLALVLVAAIATHFWIPGKGKLELDWFRATDLSNLPRNAYTAGWRGDGDGDWADRLATVIDSLGVPLRAGVLLVELGAAVAVAHLRLARVWLAFAAGFHVVVFLSTGYWFAGWVVLEVGLIVVLSRPGLMPWLSRNHTPARGLLGVAAVVVAGSTLFHPPGLAWLDAPVSYGLEIDLVGVSGRRYTAPAASFAPNEQEVAFLRLDLERQPRATGPYGVVVSAEDVRALEEISTFEELRTYEGPPTAGGPDPRAVAWLDHFVTSLNDGARAPWSWAAPPNHFWTSRPGPRYDYQERVQRVEVRRISSIQNGDRRQVLRELVFIMRVDADSGETRVVPEPTATSGPEPARSSGP